LAGLGELLAPFATDRIADAGDCCANNVGHWLYKRIDLCKYRFDGRAQGWDFLDEPAPLDVEPTQRQNGGTHADLGHFG
jgi:hypothetical protein